jgi:hypothetical protein
MNDTNTVSEYDLREDFGLTENEFLALWQKRLIRADGTLGRDRNGHLVRIGTFATELNRLRERT